MPVRARGPGLADCWQDPCLEGVEDCVPVALVMTNLLCVWLPHVCLEQME